MRLESAREAGATFLLGMVLATAVVAVGQVGLPPGMPFTPGAWDSHQSVTVPFTRSQPVADEPGDDTSAMGVTTTDDTSAMGLTTTAGHTTAADRKPDVVPAPSRWSGRTAARAPVKDRASKRPRTSRRDEPRRSPRQDRVSAGKSRHGLDAHVERHSATKGAGQRKTHGSPDRVVAQRSHKTFAAAAHRDRPTADVKPKGPARHKTHGAKSRGRGSHK